MPVTTDEIWRQFSGRLRDFIAKRVQAPADAEDILQDVFGKIHSSLSQLNNWERLEVWLFQVTRNAIIDHYRRHAKAQAVDVALLAGTGEDPVAPPAAEELGSCLRSLVDLLPEKYRRALLLAEFEGLTHKEIAERLGISVSGAKSQVQRARARLKEIVLRQCDLEFDHLGRMTECDPKRPGCG